MEIWDAAGLLDVPELRAKAMRAASAQSSNIYRTSLSTSAEKRVWHQATQTSEDEPNLTDMLQEILSPTKFSEPSTKAS